jgi:hypothetical protein
LLTAAWLIGGAVQPSSYSPMRKTVSILAGYAATDRWIMTSALVGIGICYFGAAIGLSALRPSARIALVVSGLSGIGIAASPEPVVGSTIQHMFFTTLGATAIAVWPLFTVQRDSNQRDSHQRDAPTSVLTSVRAVAVVSVIFIGMLLWLASETQNGSILGFAERLDSSLQTAWPFAIAVTLRRARAVSPTPKLVPASQP